MRRNEKGFTLAEVMVTVFFVSILFLGITGYVKNIIKLTKCDFESPYKAEVLRVIGVIPVVGAVTGMEHVSDVIIEIIKLRDELIG